MKVSFLIRQSIEDKMSPDARHALGAVLMWSSVAVTAAGSLLIAPGHPAFGAAVIALGMAGVIAGAAIKKKYCPRCRAGACELPKKNSPQPPA